MYFNLSNQLIFLSCKFDDHFKIIKPFMDLNWISRLALKMTDQITAVYYSESVLYKGTILLNWELKLG